MPELHSNKEEADTRMMLHIQHASSEGFANIVCVSADTDLLLLCMFVNAIEKFPSKIYLKRSKSKILEIPKLISAVGKNVSRALLGLHAFTGCDSVSAFSGKGKVNPFNVVLMAAFLKLGQELNVDNDVFEALQEFTCQLYSKGTKSSGRERQRERRGTALPAERPIIEII